MDVTENLKFLNKQIEQAIEQYGRAANSVKLLAVSKGQSIEKMRQAYDAGQVLFGENYLQEAQQKQNALSDCDIEWHFIGSIQSNKTKEISQHFDWVHSVDRFKIAKRLSEQRLESQRPLNICIEVNISGESTKSGVHPDKLLGLISEISALSNIKIRGLMIIPEFKAEFDEQKKIFDKLAQIQKELVEEGFNLDTLSMGMTQDFVAAIAAGSTIVRIGQGIFGQRV